MDVLKRIARAVGLVALMIGATALVPVALLGAAMLLAYLGLAVAALFGVPLVVGILSAWGSVTWNLYERIEAVFHRDPTAPKPRPVEPPAPCPHCKRTLTTQRGLEQHIAAKHALRPAPRLWASGG